MNECRKEGLCLYFSAKGAGMKIRPSMFFKRAVNQKKRSGIR